MTTLANRPNTALETVLSGLGVGRLVVDFGGTS
jgi:hypothetical protein